jgi:hypothetical protein
MARKIYSLGKTNLFTLRRYYKKINNLPANTSQQNLRDYAFVENDSQLNNLMRDEYNDSIDTQNQERLVIRQDIRRQVTQNRRDSQTFLRQFQPEPPIAIDERRRVEKSRILNLPITRLKFHKRDAITLNDLSKLREELKKHIGNSIVVKYVINNKIIKDVEYLVPEAFSKWWSSNRDWWYNSEKTIMHKNKFKGTIFIYKQNQGIDVISEKQYFRDGISHCVFQPIRIWAENKLDNSVSLTTKKRYNTILKRLTEFEKKYDIGVPEDIISEICNALQIDINIELPFCEEKLIECKSEKKKLKIFNFLNTRLNHLDFNEVVSSDNIIEVTRKEILNKKIELDNNNTFYTFRKDSNNISSITTLTENFRVNNDYGNCINQFEFETGLKYCKIDDIDDKALSDFIQLGCNYNSTIDFQDIYNIDIDTINHIDMTKAYANFESCKLYKGFLGKITDFRETNKIEGVGMYNITNLNFDNCNTKFKDLNFKMRMYFSNNLYTSPELEMLDSMNVTYDITCGCWGVKPIYFQFNEDMMTMKDEGVPYYSKWTGAIDSHKLEKQFWIKGDLNFFNVIKNNCGDKTVRWFENGEGTIAHPKKHNFHLSHITSFITAYQRLNVIEQLMSMEYNTLVRVCVDGIYYTGDIVECKNVFRQKSDKNFTNEASHSYVNQSREHYIEEYDTHSSRPHYAKELHLGAGGCGKTHLNCNDKGLIRPMFIAPSWKLARSKKIETGIPSTVWARAICTDPEMINIIKSLANTLIIDEVSMMTEGQKQQVFDLYPDMKIIFCGDLGYQISCITGEEMNESGFDNVVKHTNDYRCQDEKLNNIKQHLRYMIKNQFSNTQINEFVIRQFEKIGQCITIDTLKDNYDVNDMILSGTNEIKDFYTKMFEGKFDLEKYYVTAKSKTYCNGDIVIGEKPEHCMSEIRHCFTVHSIQGETAHSKLFIDSSKMFCSKMFYTAVSRAKRIEQIQIIIRQEQKYKYEFASVYKIVSKSGVYIGSTIKPIEKRFSEHRCSYEQYKKGNGKYMTSFKLLDDDKVKIEKIENFKCNDLKDLWEREKEIIQSTECVNETYNN